MTTEKPESAHAPKVFGIGLSKTATTSLFAALDILGYRSGTYRHLEALGLSEWFDGHFESDYLGDYEAVTDLPVGCFFRELDRLYPGSKFILTVREMAAWLASCRSFFGPRAQPSAFYVATQLRAYGSVTFDESRFAAAYDAHVTSVSTYFARRPTDLLVMDVFAGDGWEELCRFLGHEVPASAFPNVKPGYRPARENTPQAEARQCARSLTRWIARLGGSSGSDVS